MEGYCAQEKSVGKTEKRKKNGVRHGMVWFFFFGSRAVHGGVTDTRYTGVAFGYRIHVAHGVTVALLAFLGMTAKQGIGLL